MKVIVPCCGASSRFPGQPPKWTLPAHDGRPMLCLAVSGLKFPLDELVITILREHEEQFDIAAGLASAFGRPVHTVILDQATRSQSETVARTLAALDLDEPFLVKDSDGYFAIDDLSQDYNYVCVDSLNNFDAINPRNKSYLQVDHRGIVINIREKVVISDLFNVGGYYFQSPKSFLEFYERLSHDKAAWNREIYLSDVIGAMILDGIPFQSRRTTGYEDWGTIREWRRALLSKRTYLVVLDGFALERGSAYFRPTFAEAKPHPQAVEALQALVRQGHTLIYLSIRPESLTELTRQQMAAAGLPEGTIVWNCPIAKWSLVTAPHPTLPFTTSEASEIAPDRADLLLSLGDH